MTKLLFLVVYKLLKFFLKFSFSIKNPILKMIDYDFSMKDFMQRCLFAIMTFHSVEGSWKWARSRDNALDLGEKITFEIH